MKNLISVLLVSSFFTINAQVNLSSSLTACYALDGNAVEPINNLNGLISSVTPTVNRFNTANTAMYFSGNSASYIELQDTSLLKPANALSFSCWMKTPNLMNGYILFTKNSQGNYFEAYELCIDGSLHFMTRKAGSSGMDMVVSTTSLVANTWYHLVTTLDDYSVNLYVDGVLEASTPATTIGFDYTSGKKVYLGTSHESSFDSPFIGTLDNVRFYDRTLTSAEVSALYTQDPQCVTIPAPTASFSASSNTICKGQNVTFTNQSTSGSTYQWNFAGGSPASSTLASPPTINYSVSGVYNVTLTVTNSTGSTSSITQITVNECAAPTSSFTASFKSICKGQNVTFTNQSLGGTSYQWTFAGGSPATSTLATPPTVIYNTLGAYNVTLTVTNSNGSTSVVQQITVNGCTGISEHSSAFDVVLYPNPCNGILFIRGDMDQETTIELCDLTGKIVLRKNYLYISETEMDLSDLNSGIYFLKVQSGGKSKVTKLFKEN